jgi:hypothetical protein
MITLKMKQKIANVSEGASFLKRNIKNNGVDRKTVRKYIKEYESIYKGYLEVLRMDIDKLKSKNIKVIEIPKWGAYLRKEWENNFANHLSDKEKRSIYLFDNGGYCGYLWHIFSYKKKDCLEGEKAEEAFTNEPKNKCYVFYQHSDYALLLENASKFNANDLIDKTGIDIYVVDKQFRWTFVITHETGRYFGPYFSRKGTL